MNNQQETQNQDNSSGNNEPTKPIEVTPNKKVMVYSKTLNQVKVVVVFKKIKPQQDPSRKAFNIYLFDYESKCEMPERDAILFLKQRKSMEGMEYDVTIADIKTNEKYPYKKIVELESVYKVEEVGLEDSFPRQ